MANAPDPQNVPTRKQAAAELGITERQLSYWSEEPWFPAGAVERDARGRRCNWNVSAIRAARNAMGRKGSEHSDTALKVRLKTDHEKLKQAEVRTQKDQIDLAVKQGRLIPRDALEIFASALLTALGSWADQLPDLIAVEVPKKYRKPLKDRLVSELNARRAQAANDLAAAARDFDATHSVEVDQQNS